MKDSKTAVNYVVGGSFVVLGVLLLASLVNWINSVSIYQTTLPIVLIIGGFSLFSSSNEKNRRTGLGLGMLTFGIISLLVRFDVLSGKTVNAILGMVLLVTGTIVLTKIADKHAVKSTDV